MSRYLLDTSGNAPSGVGEAVASLFGDPEQLGLTLAALVVQDGTVIAERYGPTAGPDTTLISWSMAKSVTHALIGLLVLDGRLNVNDPAPIAEWQGDDRQHITIQQLLWMRSGLLFNEDYIDAGTSHCIEMLFGAGQADVAGYACSLPLAYAPGSFWSYSSGTTNILCRIARDIIGDGEAGMRAYLQDRLFGPLGMSSADPRFDAAGTFIGSSFLYATARDFARFGLLYLDDGVVDGVRILPEGWVDHGRAPTEVPATETYGYGSQWWLWPYDRSMACQGYECQRIVVLPDRRSVVVRLGKTPADLAPNVDALLRKVIDSLA